MRYELHKQSKVYFVLKYASNLAQVVVYFNIRAIRTARSPILGPMLFKLIHTFSFHLGLTSFRHQFKGMCKITS